MLPNRKTDNVKKKKKIHLELWESFLNSFTSSTDQKQFQSPAVSQPARLRNIQALVVSTLWCNG